jgi:hypothetical protein
MADQPKKEPMIGKENRPTPIDYDAPLSGMKVRDLLGVLSAHSSEQLKNYPEYFKPEQLKPEHLKPEFYKPESLKPEHYKPEYFKPEIFKEFQKPEAFKPPEGFKPDPTDLIQQVAERVVGVLKERGLVK